MTYHIRHVHSSKNEPKQCNSIDSLPWPCLSCNTCSAHIASDMLINSARVQNVCCQLADATYQFASHKVSLFEKWECHSNSNQCTCETLLKMERWCPAHVFTVAVISVPLDLDGMVHSVSHTAANTDSQAQNFMMMSRTRNVTWANACPTWPSQTE